MCGVGVLKALDTEGLRHWRGDSQTLELVGVLNGSLSWVVCGCVSVCVYVCVCMHSCSCGRHKVLHRKSGVGLRPTQSKNALNQSSTVDHWCVFLVQCVGFNVCVCICTPALCSPTNFVFSEGNTLTGFWNTRLGSPSPSPTFLPLFFSSSFLPLV